MGLIMKDKVESYSNYIVKYNTARFSNGLEWFTEFFSINHKRELRVYRCYNKKSHNNLLIPEAYELTSKYIKIEKLIEIEKREILVSELIPSLKEFILLGVDKKMNFYDFMSSPTQSVLRGLIRNARFLGVKLIFQALKHLFIIYTNKPRVGSTYLIHKDLKKDQNMMPTKNGIYFIDFGSSILTKYYFLTDIVELSTDHLANKVNFDLLETFIKELGVDKYSIEYLRSQIYLLLLRRYLHFPEVDRANELKMSNVRNFLGNLDSLVSNFKIK
jgi:hypothetical protein